MNPEKQPSNEQLSLASINTQDIVLLLEKYNKQFGMGVTAAKMIQSVCEEEDDTKNKEDKTTALENQAADQLISYDQMQVESEKLLAATGLEFQPIKANWFVTGSEGTHIGSEMRLNLKDGKQFITYLQSLKPELITKNQKDGLEKIALVLTKQFTSEYDLDNPDDERLMELMGNLSQIISEYERIGGDESADLKESISVLENYLLIARQGCLREYRIAEKLRLNRPFTKDGFILRWHTDANPDFLKRQWDSVIDALQMISQNKKAGEIYSQAKMTAEEALESAITEVSIWSKNKGIERNKQEFLTILNSTKKKLVEF